MGRLVARQLAAAAVVAASLSLPGAPHATVEIPSETAHSVHDYAGVVLNEDTRDIETIAGEMKDKCRVSLSVVTLKSLEGEPIDTLARRWFDAWGLGAGGRNGILLLISVGDGSWRVEAGSQEPFRLDPDAIAWFERGDFSVGTRRAVEGLARLSARKAGVTIGLPDSALPRSILAGGGKLVVLVGLILLVAGGGPALVWFLLLRSRETEGETGRS